MNSLFVIMREGRKEAETISTEEYYEYLIDTYQNLIYSICFKLVRDYFDAEDLAQETFLSAYKHLPSFDRLNDKAWLCRIATNKCFDYLKRAERKSIPTEDDYFYDQKCRGPSPEENVLEQELKTQLFERCNNLKTPYKEIALDYFYKELTPSQIADTTGKNIKTVQTQIYRAKAMLQKKYKKEAD